MSRSSYHPALRYGVSVLAVVVGAALLAIPGIGQTPNMPVLILYAAILVAAWYGGLGPGLLATSLIAAVTLSGPASVWRMIRLALFVTGGATISLLIEALHAARRRAEDAHLQAQDYLAGERAARQEAEDANRAKDRFLAALSHELRTPLAPVLIAVSAAVEDGDDASRPMLEMIRRNIELEARLIDDLLDVSRIVHKGGLRLVPEVVDIHRAIHRAVEICRDEAAAAGLGIALELSAEEHHARVDATRMLQVFWNLIRNAAKFTPAGGTLTIRSRHEPAASPGSDGGRLVVEFQDTGIGIVAAVLPRIFEPFEQGDQAGRGRVGGLGLGLAISRAVVEAHDGRLTATSPGRGQGTTFRLELATTVAPAGEVPSRPTPSSAVGRREGLRILLVEDNQDTLRHLALALRRRGHGVIEAADLASARAAAAAGTFDLMICDNELPDGSGLDLMGELGGDRVATGIALSGYGSEDDVRLSRARGFAAHLTKPVDFPRLEATIQRITSAGRSDPQPPSR